MTPSKPVRREPLARKSRLRPVGTPLRVGTFCSGIAAPEVAWRSLGWHPQFFSEIDPFASAVLAHHFPGVPNLGDMEAITREQVQQFPLDVVCAGTPCQSFSVAGLRGGMADPRGNLALVFLRLVDWIRPRWLVWENVPGVLSSEDGRDFGTFLGALGQLGYGWAYRILDAQHFGVPQRRRRVFVVGHLGDWRLAASVLFERHCLSGHPAPGREAGARVAASLTRGADSSGAGGYAGRRREDDFNLAVYGGGNCSGELDVAAYITAKGQRQDFEVENFVTHSLRADGFDASEDGTGRGTPIVPVAFGWNKSAAQTMSVGSITNPVQASTTSNPAVAYQCQGSNVGPRGVLTKGNGNETSGVPFIIHENQRGEISTSETAESLKVGGGKPGQGYPAVAYTIHGTNKTARVASEADVSQSLRTRAPGQQENSSTTVAMSSGMAVRRLTPRECERLQGFPDDHTLIPYRNKPAADGPRYRAIGNSMAVPVLRWIGERIEKVEAVIAGKAGAS